MNRTVNNDDISRVLAQMDRMKKDEADIAEATAAAASVSAIGTNTPMTLLIDIRQAIGDQTDVLKRNQQVMIQQMEQSEKMHSESIAYMQELSELLRRTPVATLPHHLPTRLGTSTGNNTPEDVAIMYYHQGDVVDTNMKLMACMLIQLERISSRNMGPVAGATLDTVSMELKDWVSVIKSITKADCNVTDKPGKLSLPKITSTEGQYVLNVMTSPTKGRNVMCKGEHFNDIATNCPAMTGCMEEIRIRILRCPGVIGMQRALALASIPFPYIDDNGDVIRVDVAKKGLGSSVLADKVSRLNVPQRDVYITCILRDGDRPMIAAGKGADYSTKRTTI